MPVTWATLLHQWQFRFRRKYRVEHKITEILRVTEQDMETRAWLGMETYLLVQTVRHGHDCSGTTMKITTQNAMLPLRLHLLVCHGTRPLTQALRM